MNGAGVRRARAFLAVSALGVSAALGGCDCGSHGALGSKNHADAGVDAGRTIHNPQATGGRGGTHANAPDASTTHASDAGTANPSGPNQTPGQTPGQTAHGDAGSPPATGSTSRFPLRWQEGARYLIDQQGQPFFWAGDAAWSLIAQPNLSDAQSYLDDRQSKGFDVVLVNLIEHKFAKAAPANAAGDRPFTAATFSTPNEAYFAHVDDVIRYAASREIVVLLAPLYLGYDCGDEGWCAEVKKTSVADMQNWGRYVGKRYASFDNIVWLIGGDADPTPVADKVRALVAGIREFDSRHLMSAHNAPESFAVGPWPNESWLTINDVYSYDSALYEQDLQAYQQSRVMPFFLAESNYEHEHDATTQTVRAQAYWSLLSGAMGHIFGNCPIWHMSSTTDFCTQPDWKTEWSSAGAQSMQHLQRLFTARPWHMLVPDTQHETITAGYGSSGDDDYATAARASDGATTIAYLPKRRALTVDMSRTSGSQARASWYNPATGVSTAIGMFPTSGTQMFTPPAAGDWVLVIDDAARGFNTLTD
jgi:Protein of unknown function (DUF4038)/Putative collagen-binding domain of a collagenase